MLLLLGASVAAASGVVRIRRAYINLSDHCLHIEFLVKPGVLGWVLIYIDGEFRDAIPTSSHLNGRYHLVYPALLNWHLVEIYVVDVEGRVLGYDWADIHYVLLPSLPIIPHL